MVVYLNETLILESNFVNLIENVSAVINETTNLFGIPTPSETAARTHYGEPHDYKNKIYRS